jgi:hypothetical protein
MRQSKRVFQRALVVLSLISASGLGVAGQQTGRTPPPLLIPSVSGGDLFRFYCASCHGREGRGDGPVASALNRRPADLTAISAHGSADMPVWGPIFQVLDPQDRMNRIRIENVVAFLESIQSK